MFIGEQRSVVVVDSLSRVFELIKEKVVSMLG